MDVMMSLINTVPILKNSYRQALNSNRRTWSCSNAFFEFVPNTLDQIKIRRSFWPFHTLHCFSFKKALHKMNCMKSCIKKKEIMAAA
ncbi:hypothetical protein TNCV_1357541 [Trichonephila clavipes]|uniref:Uncharacterized protein n=1 Tax=Trichonephila clavipes TaxID=2585209 RepID=A0A8X6VHU9_TRICX|nr:hypothetical protein TNCV_1357541 [Trichonephila clavipes]